MEFADALGRLERLSPEELDQTSRRIRGDLASAEWKMGLCLLAWSRNGAFRNLGFSSVSEYAERVLNLSGRKIGALLGAARALEHLPLLSDAFRRGEIGWGKIRVIHGLATPETEEKWLEFASAHGTEEVARRVTLSPTQWKHHRALKASLKGAPLVTREQVNAVLETSNDAHRPAPPTAPKTIRLVVELDPDQYALYEQAEIRIRAQVGRRLCRAKVVTAMAENILNHGTARARAKHQILVHTAQGSEKAWYDTERGMLPVSSRVLEQARQHSVRSQSTNDKNRAKKPVNPSKNRRSHIPNSIVRALYAQAGHRCQRCRVGRGPLHIHHTVPVSEGGGSALQALQLLCPACHHLRHQEDFEVKPSWRLAKHTAIQQRATDVLAEGFFKSKRSKSKTRRHPRESI